MGKSILKSIQNKTRGSLGRGSEYGSFSSCSLSLSSTKRRREPSILKQSDNMAGLGGLRRGGRRAVHSQGQSLCSTGETSDTHLQSLVSPHLTPRLTICCVGIGVCVCLCMYMSVCVCVFKGDACVFL